MTGQDLVDFTAKWARLYDQTNSTILTNKYMKEADLLDFVDARYRENAAPELKKNYAKFFEETFRLDNWEATGVVHATSTGSTLDATTAIFDSNMIGAKVYNSTDSESRTITGYTDTTTVTVDEAIDDTWDGDTIYVLSGKIKFISDLASAIEPIYLAIKYTDTDTEFRQVWSSEFEEVNEYSHEDTLTTSTYAPESYFGTEKDATGKMYTVINFRPLPSVPVSKGIYFKATVHPSALTLTTEPRLPLGHHQFLSWGAAADAGRALGLKEADINYFEGKYKEGLGRMLSTFKPRKRMFRQSYRNHNLINNRYKRQRILDTQL